MKRICKNCGNIVKGKGRFCDKCGAELVEDENTNDTPVQEKKRRKWPVIIAAILVVCIAVSSVILLSGNTAAPYKKILNATQKTIQTSTYFTINGDPPLKIIDLFDCAGCCYVFAASLPLVGLEVGNGDFRRVIKGIHEKLILLVQCSQSFLVKLNLFVGQTPGFLDGRVISGECCEGSKLRRTI